VAADVDAVYRDTYPDAVARGIPLHITVLFPFVPVERLDEAALARARSVVARHEPFAFALTEVRTFEEHVWLAPEPAEPFRALTRSLHAEFPEQPPYGGVFEGIVPHATMAHVDEHEVEAVAAAIGARVQPFLPVQLRADAVTVLREDAPEQWREERRLTLGGAA
jgi:2'-5' RNA ligase